MVASGTRLTVLPTLAVFKCFVRPIVLIMDLQAVKVLLEAQDKTFKTAIDIVVEQLKSRIQLAEGTIADLIKSLEYTQSETKDLQNEVKVLRKSDIENKATIDILKLRIEELEKRQNYQEDYQRRNNLRFTGIQEHSGGETWEETAETISKLLEEKLQLPKMKLERAHRTGPTSSSPRTIVARFERFGDREAVLRNARKLKGTRIYVNEDLCPASQELKKSQFPLLKQAREAGKIAYFRHTKLIVKDRTTQQSRDSGDDVLVGRVSGDVTTQLGAGVMWPGPADPAVAGPVAEERSGAPIPAIAGASAVSPAAAAALGASAKATSPPSTPGELATSGTGADGSTSDMSVASGTPQQDQRARLRRSRKK